jgi:hypothetical protein
MTTLVTTGDHFGGRPRRIASVSKKMPLQAGQRNARERRPYGCMTVPSLGHFHSVCVSSVMTRSSFGLRRRCGAADQPTQRISGSFRATGAGMVVGYPTMIGATGTHVAGRPSTAFPSGVFR